MIWLGNCIGFEIPKSFSVALIAEPSLSEQQKRADDCKHDNGEKYSMGFLLKPFRDWDFPTIHSLCSCVSLKRNMHLSLLNAWMLRSFLGDIHVLKRWI